METKRYKRNKCYNFQRFNVSQQITPNRIYMFIILSLILHFIFKHIDIQIKMLYNTYITMVYIYIYISYVCI